MNLIIERARFFTILNSSLDRSYDSRTINVWYDVYLAHECRNSQQKVRAKRGLSGNELRGCRNKLCSILESRKIGMKKNEKIKNCYKI